MLGTQAVYGVFEDTGAKAIATTSAGVAWALGYPDGNALPVEKLATVVASITNVIRAPLSVALPRAKRRERHQYPQLTEPNVTKAVSGLPIPAAWAPNKAM
jgi:hypothetical protein